LSYSWIEIGVKQEQQRILEELQKLENQSHKTRTPLYQEFLFERFREIVLGKEFKGS
jgi:hypothetical protein